MAKNQTKAGKANVKQAKSSTKPFAIIAFGVAAALVAAVFLMRGGGEETATAAGTAMAFTVDSSNARFLGSESAKVTLVEFGDYQCPTCAYYHPIVSQLLARFPSDLRLAYHHFPLMNIHPNALPAAKAAEAAGEQGRFWEMHDLLFEYQPVWSSIVDAESLFASYAVRLGLDRDRFLQDYRSSRIQDRVMADVAQARDLRLSGTPTFLINGRPVPLPGSLFEFEAVIAQAIVAAE